jgi:hypothetical protein
LELGTSKKRKQSKQPEKQILDIEAKRTLEKNSIERPSSIEKPLSNTRITSSTEVEQSGNDDLIMVDNSIDADLLSNPTKKIKTATSTSTIPKAATSELVQDSNSDFSEEMEESGMCH